MRIVFFELEGWEETLLKETSFDGHALELSTHPPLNHSLLNRDSVVITPHIAFNSREAVQRILETTLENVRAYLRGQPQNLVGGD